MRYRVNKKFVDPRYFLYEDTAPTQPSATGATASTESSTSATAPAPPSTKEARLGLQAMVLGVDVGEPDAGDQEFVQGVVTPPVGKGADAIVERARSVIGKGWTYSLQSFGGQPQGGPKDPKPDPAQVYPQAAGAFCDCTGFASWSAGQWQKRGKFANGLTNNLGQPVENPMPGDIAYRGPPPGGENGHVGIVAAVNPPNATTTQINAGQGDVTIVHCSSRRSAGGAVVEDPDAIHKLGWAGRGELGKTRRHVMFYRPTELMNSKDCCSTRGVSAGKWLGLEGQPPQQQAQQTQQASRLKEEKNVMRHNTWDKMMYRLLSEQAEKRRIAEKAFAGKKELDNDEDGVPKWADKNDKDPNVGSKGKKSKGKKGKVPPQLKMHIQKKKKSKLDESIERLERILINEATVSDFKKFPINIVHERGKEAYQDSIVAIVSFEFPGTPIRSSDFGPDQAPNVEKVPVLKRFMDKKRSGEFKPKYDTRESDSYQYWLEEMLALPKKIHPEAEIYFDDSGARGSCEIVFDTEDKASFMEFASKLSEMTEELDELGGYDVLVYSGKLKHRNGENFVPYQGKRYYIKDKLLQNLDKDLPDDEEVGISAPGAVAGGQVAESIRRLKRLLKEYEALEEYGEDRYPDMAEEDDDDDFEDDEDDYDDDDEDVDDHDDDVEDDFESQDISAEDSEAYEGELEEGDQKEFKCKTSDDCVKKFGKGTVCIQGGVCRGTGYRPGPNSKKMEIGDEPLVIPEVQMEYLSEAEVKKKQPRLGKVTRNPAGSNKKFHVYVKCGGRVKKISFGDPGLSIKRDSAARRKNFRARHKCDKPAGKDRCTARYWSCYQWRAGKKVEGEE